MKCFHCFFFDATLQVLRLLVQLVIEGVTKQLLMGQVPNPTNGKLEIHLKAARSVLDSLEMLELKTTGNRTPEEDKLLQTALLNLRNLYSGIEAREKT